MFLHVPSQHTCSKLLRPGDRPALQHVRLPGEPQNCDSGQQAVKPLGPTTRPGRFSAFSPGAQHQPLSGVSTNAQRSSGQQTTGSSRPAKSCLGFDWFPHLGAVGGQQRALASPGSRQHTFLLQQMPPFFSVQQNWFLAQHFAPHSSCPAEHLVHLPFRHCCFEVQQVLPHFFVLGGHDGRQVVRKQT